MDVVLITRGLLGRGWALDPDKDVVTLGARADRCTQDVQPHRRSGDTDDGTSVMPIDV